jgi:hypothetical protein
MPSIYAKSLCYRRLTFPSRNPPPDLPDLLGGEHALVVPLSAS